MADETTAQAAAARETEEVDPIVTGSLSWPLALASLLLVLTTVWATYDEFIGRRPWKKYQARFPGAYKGTLNEAAARQRKKEDEIEKGDEYQRLKAAYVEIVNEVKPEREKLNKRLALVALQMEAITRKLREARSYTAATIYKIETASTPERKEKLLGRLAEFHLGPFEVKLPDSDGGTTPQKYRYRELLGVFNKLKDDKSDLRRKLGELVQKEAVKKKTMDAYMAKHLDGPTSARILDRIGGLAKFKYDITSHQIHVKEVGLVDRCEVCHLAIRSSAEVTAEDIRRADPTMTEEMARVFTSHPRIELSGGDLLKVHDPDKFGCTPCHGGNGRALSSVKEAHGEYKHWLWPMHEKDSVEAGCVQCHDGAQYLEGAPTLNRGRYLFGQLGCWGCHQRAGYDAEAIALKNITQDENRIRKERARLGKELMGLETADADEESGDFDEEFDEFDEDEEAAGSEIVDRNEAFDVLKLKLSRIDAEEEQLQLREAGLERARKRPGPNLKEVRAKLRKEWISVWLNDPRAFRPTTRMPHFGLDEAPPIRDEDKGKGKGKGKEVEQAKAIAAFIWQNALDETAPEHGRGNPSRGKKAFETRGCLACHSVGRDRDDPREETFAADLSRVGEKVNYNYLVEWIRNPLENAFMPDLRLSEQEARDAAAYLMEQKTDARYEPADYLAEKSLALQGEDLVRHYACFGCHEIAGMENLGKIGTELTKVGSKPIERLDFALFTREAKVDGWYTHKGFFDRKLSEPRAFDEGKHKLDWREKLKMPDFDLKDRSEDRVALMTFLLGSVDSRLPDFFYHNPAGWAKDVEQGWWIVKKYNCVGCHQMEPGAPPDLWKLPRYQGENRAKAPPGLVGTGARLHADWLADFLRDPALTGLGGAQTSRNGVRMYLDIRMPTFSLSEDEIGKLVRFFGALSRQPSPYPHEELEPLAKDELTDARLIFARSKCLNCHVTSDDPRTFTSETKAPGYLVSAKRLKPQWNRLWLRDPDKIMPGTVMPSGLFKFKKLEVGGRWRSFIVRDKELASPEADHVELMVRYLKFFNQAEADVQQQLQEAGNE